MRFGDYEVIPNNQWCYQIFKVMDEGFDNERAKYRVAPDGRALMPMSCYPQTLAAACMKIVGFAEKDAAESGDAADVEKRLTALYGKISAVAASMDQ